MPFAREADGRISQRFFGAHTFRRTAFAGDYTGLEIQRVLVHRAEALGLPILDTAYITKLLVRDNVVFGAYGFDLRDGTRYVIRADAVILAAGGHTRIWRRTSSRRDENTGDSFRLAVEAGARIRDPELVQFHPSGLIEPEQVAGTLVSEAARGEGGHPPQRPRRALHGALRPGAHGAVHPRPRRARLRTPRSRRVAGHPTAASGSTSRTSRTRRSCVVCRASIRRCSSCRCSTSRRRRSRSRPPRTTRWAASGCARRTVRRVSRASTRSARRPAACTAPIASAATRWSSSSCTGASPAGRRPPTRQPSRSSGGRRRPSPPLGRRSTACSPCRGPRTCARCSAGCAMR